ncbi:MAG: hypothetical protein HY257_01790 [Chloroflexi bacterium]|nr:hypothetical protein [Chloroflexota bacterium]
MKRRVSLALLIATALLLTQMLAPSPVFADGPTTMPVAASPTPAPTNPPANFTPASTTLTSVSAPASAASTTTASNSASSSSSANTTANAAPDPYLLFNGTTYRFLSDCGIFSNCTKSATPIQAAINFFAQNAATIVANDRAVFVDGGTYRENISINGLSNFSLRGSANGSRSVIDGSVTIANSIGINLSAFTVQQGVAVSKSQNVAVTSVTTNQIKISQSQNVTVSNSQVTTNDATKPAIEVEASEKVHVENVNLDSFIRVDNSAHVSIIGSGVNAAFDLLANNVSALDVLSSGNLTLSGDSRVTSPSGLVNLRAGGALTMARGSVIDASGIGNANGGAVNMLASDAVNFYGTILARGGTQSGNGGAVEISAHQVNYDGVIDLRAAHGKTGMLLLDPTDFFIKFSGGNITGAALSSQLNAANVTIQTSSAGGQAGNISVQDSIAWSSANTLTLRAHNDIYIGVFGTTIANTGAGSLVLRADSDADGSGDIEFDCACSQVVFNLSTGTITFFYNPTATLLLTKYENPTDFSAHVLLNSSIVGGNFTAYMLVNTLQNLQDMNTNVNGNYALGTDIDASATNNDAGFTTAGFMPIGDGNITNFGGIFNGDMHTITGLFINRPSTDYVGLFGSTLSDATLKNVGLVSANITGQSLVGALAGQSFSIVSNSYNTGAVSGIKSAGWWGRIILALLAIPTTRVR